MISVFCGEGQAEDLYGNFHSHLVSPRHQFLIGFEHEYSFEGENSADSDSSMPEETSSSSIEIIESEGEMNEETSPNDSNSDE